MAGIQAFRESFVSSDTLDETSFTDFESRRLRYQIYWACYENTVYRDIHSWAKMYRATFGLYRYIRNIYNPSYRLGEFWKSHLMGGALDLEAGDGNNVPSCLPVITDNDLLRLAIAQVWRWSNWQTNKDILSLWGAILGDVILKVNDVPAKEKVYLQIVHPGTVSYIEKDLAGNIRGYVIEEKRTDPDNQSKSAIYKEVAGRDGNAVRYQTFKNGSPYPWNGNAAEWTEDYGFIPMVAIQHNSVGLDWGWSELHPEQSKFREVDDLSSKLSDQIRKMVDAPWLFSGVENPSKRGASSPTTSQTQPSTSNLEPGREEIPALYGPLGADAKPLVANLDIGSTSNYIDGILKHIERDYPELGEGVNNIQGDISGRALRIHREPIENKVKQRRASYDDGLVRALQMAVSIGALRSYPAFTAFSLDSFDRGDLDFNFGDRPVFAKDKADDLEYEKEFWTVAGLAKTAGLPMEMFLERRGWSQEDIAKFTASAEFKARQASLEMATQMSRNFPDGNQDNQGRPGVMNG